MTLEGNPPAARPELTEEELRELQIRYNTDVLNRIAAACGLKTSMEKHK